MNARGLVAFVSVAVLATLLGAYGGESASAATTVTPTASQDAAPAGGDATAPIYAPATVKLSHAISLDDADSLKTRVSDPVVGFRFENPGIVGEFYPSPTRNKSQFLTKFQQDYGTQPQIVGLIVKRPYNSKSHKVAPGIKSLTIAGKAFKAVAPKLTEISQAQTRAQPVAGNASGSVVPQGKSAVPQGKLSTTPAVDIHQDDASQSTAWVPETAAVQIENSGGRVAMQEFLSWGGSSPDLIPSNYGLEVEINAWNNTLTTLDRPDLCPEGYDDDFFAENEGFNWTAVTGTTQDLDDLQAYSDTDIADGCNKSSFTVGLRYPQSIEATSSGAHELLINIDAKAGDLAQNPVSSDLQLVDDYDCPIGPGADLADCMGQAQVPLVGIAPGATTLNKNRKWFAPDRCWTATDYLTKAVPGQNCGQPGSLTGINVTDFASSPDDSGGFDLFLSNDSCNPIAVGSVPFEPYESRFPYAFDSDRATTSDLVGDVRAWIGTTEVPITGTGWEWDSPTTGATLQLSNPSGVTLGDGSAAELAEFADNGTLSFRVNNGSANYFRIEGLSNEVTGTGTSAPSFVVTGDAPDWSTSLESVTGTHTQPICTTINPSTSAPDNNHQGITYDGNFYFPGTDNTTYNSGLAEYDGTSVSMIPTDPMNVSGLTVYNDDLYFLGTAGTFDDTTSQWSYDTSLYKYDGTTLTKIPGNGNIATGEQFPGGAGPTEETELAPLGNKIYFIGTDPTHGYQPWAYDIDTGAISMVAAVLPTTDGQNTNVEPYGLVSADNTLYFVGGTTTGSDGNPDSLTVWASDGTDTPTVTNIPAISGTGPSAMSVMGGHLYVTAAQSTDDWFDNALWRLDGATGSLVTDTDDNPVYPDFHTPLLTSDSDLYFVSAASGGIDTAWTYNGTNAVDPVAAPAGTYLQPLGIAKDAGKVIFSASDSTHGYEPWVYDGSSLALLSDLAAGPSSSYPTWVGQNGPEAFLSASGVMWTTDGTTTAKTEPELQYPVPVGTYTP